MYIGRQQVSPTVLTSKVLASGTIDIKSNGDYDVSQYANARVNVPTEGGITPSGTISITENGTHEISQYEYAEVNVKTEGGYPEPSGEITIESNGQYNVKDVEFANVNVPEPSGETTITENGTFDVKSVATAIVNVPATIPEGYIRPEGSVSITSNGTVDVTNYASAIVNVGSTAGTAAGVRVVNIGDKIYLYQVDMSRGIVYYACHNGSSLLSSNRLKAQQYTPQNPADLTNETAILESIAEEALAAEFEVVQGALPDTYALKSVNDFGDGLGRYIGYVSTFNNKITLKETVDIDCSCYITKVNGVINILFANGYGRILCRNGTTFAPYAPSGTIVPAQLVKSYSSGNTTRKFNITANGDYNVENYDEVNVFVADDIATQIIDRSISSSDKLNTYLTKISTIGWGAFASCHNLTSINIPANITVLGYGCFRDCDHLRVVSGMTGVTSIDNAAFRGCTSLTSMIIPDSVTAIPAAVFQNCSGLTSVTIGNSVASIGNDAFNSCIGLTNVTIPDSVTSIGDWAFNSCTGLISVTIGNGVTSIGYSALAGCTSLTSITIPSAVTKIDNYAFSECTALTSITFNGTQSGWNSITKGTDWNKNVPATYVQCTDGQVAL